MKKIILFLTLLTTITIAKNNVEIIHGHQLPPQPDPDLNNATLGGVDSNENGVRDDVERAIYKKYDKKLHVVVLMQTAKFFQRTLVEPVEDAKIIQKDSTRSIDCEVFLGRTDKKIKSMEWLKEGEFVDNLTFNTVERVKNIWIIISHFQVVCMVVP